MFSGVLLEPLLHCIPMSLLMGGAGCLIVWHRLAYLCDAIAHGAILGVVLAALMHLPDWMGVLGMATLITVMLLSNRSADKNDVKLMIGGYGSMGFAFAILSQRPDLIPLSQGYWMGDVLLMNRTDGWILMGLTTLGIGLMVRHWKSILRWSFDPDLAQTEGCPVRWLQIGLLMGMSLVVMVSVKMIGSLLLPILLIVPATTAAIFAKTPLTMLLQAIGLTAWDLCTGLLLSWQWDIPSGAAISITAILTYGVISLKKWNTVLSNLNRRAQS